MERRVSIAVMLLLLVVGALLYSNSRHHEFALDDDHSIVRNPALRSLDRIPSYFVEPKTFSVLHTNIDYRPVLQMSYAFNYAVSEYRMSSWHWTQVAIHIWCAWALFHFTRLLLKRVGRSMEQSLTIAGLTALAFVIHPVNSGVVNYVSARSSSLTAAFLLTAMCLELMERRKTAWVFLLLALFTKVEAVAAMAVFWGLSVLRSDEPWPRRFLGRPREWAPYLLAVVIYIVARQIAMQGIDFAGFAGATGVTRWMYLCTQITAWWVYLFHWFSPFHLVADNSSYPVFDGLAHPPVVLALVGWGFVVVGLWKVAKEYPHFPLLALSCLALLSPTSSIVPLAEMMNEHRPYLPVALVTVIFITGLVRLGESLPKPGQYAVVGLTFVWLGCMASVTWQRNRVFDNATTYWADVLAKAPSARAHNNFGLTLMKQGKIEEARRHFEESVKLAPGYGIAHINLAISLNQLGLLTEARQHYDFAVTFDRGDGNSQLWRGRFFLKTREYQRALADFQTVERLTNDHYSVALGMAQAYAGLGRPLESAEYGLKAGRIDFSRFGTDFVAMVDPYFASNAEAENGLVFLSKMIEEWPKVSWLHANRATLLRRLGREQEADEATNTAKALQGL